MRNNPTAFHRVRAITSLLAAAMSLPRGALRDLAISEVPDYYSRGKGKGNGLVLKYPHLSNCNNSLTNKPHQSNREMTRRVRQLSLGIIHG